VRSSHPLARRQWPFRWFTTWLFALLIDAGDRVTDSARGIASRSFKRGEAVTSSINGMRIAGIVLAVATRCGATEASAQLYLNITGGNAPGPGIAGPGTVGPGMGRIGSPTGDPATLGIGGAGFGSSQGLGIPLFNQGAGRGGDIARKATGTAPDSLSSALDGPSSPVNSATNTLTGSVSNAVPWGTTSATNPPAKRKQSNKAGATSLSGRSATVVAPKTSLAGSP
jgi:hypothetical protein